MSFNPHRRFSAAQSSFLHLIVFLSSFFLLNVSAFAQNKFKVGDKVEVLIADYLDSWVKGEVIQVNEQDEYRVRYDEGGTTVFLEASKLRFPGQKTTKKNAEVKSQDEPRKESVYSREQQSGDDDKPSKPIQAFTSLPGTGWSVDVFNRGEAPKRGGGVVQTFLFCKSGRFDNVRPGGSIGALRGAYKITGNTLSLYDESGKARGQYKVIWHKGKNIVDLDNGGKMIYRLFNGMPTECK